MKGRRGAYFAEAGGFVDTPVYDRYALEAGVRIDGPAIVEERESTTIVPPGDSLEVDAHLNLIIHVTGATGLEHDEAHVSLPDAIARIDLGIALAALGSPDEAVAEGRRALASPRVVDSVLSRAGDLDSALTARYPDLPEADIYPLFAPTENFVDVILSRAENGSPARLGLSAMKVIEAACESARTHSSVTLGSG